MNEPQNTGFADRLKTAADARQALLQKFRPKAAVSDPQFAERGALRAAELNLVRQQRLTERADKKLAAAAKIQAGLDAQAALEAEALDAKRGQRKERKALTKAEEKAKRDARYAARKARQ